MFEKLHGTIFFIVFICAICWAVCFPLLLCLAELVVVVASTCDKCIFKKNHKKLTACRKYLKKYRTDKEKVYEVALYRLAMIGRYFFPYVLVLITWLEFDLIINLFNYSTIESNELFFFFLMILLLIVVTFAVITAGLLLNERLRLYTNPAKKYEPMDRLMYLVSFALFCGEIYRSCQDEYSIFNGLFTYIVKDIQNISASSLLFSVVGILGISYAHYKVFQLCKACVKKKAA